MATNLRLGAAVRFEEFESLEFTGGPGLGLIDGSAKEDPIAGYVGGPGRPEPRDPRYRVRSHGRASDLREARV